MTTDTSERGLERLICTALTGHPCDPGAGPPSEVRERPAAYGAGWICGGSDDYDREYCVDRAQLSAFLWETQGDAAEALDLGQDGPTRRKLLARLQGEITKRGTIDVLRHGIKHGAHHLDLFYGTPSPGNVKALEILVTKYLKAGISYEGIQRIESYPMPESALREALLNAVVHRDYAVAAPIQIRVYADRLLIWNPGELPEGWSMGKLLGPHPSQPYNPDIANAFFWSGDIEAWGRGIQRILGACRAAGTPEPRIEVDGRDFWFEFPFSAAYLDILASGEGPSGSWSTVEAREKPREKPREKTRDAVPTLIAELPTITTAELAERIGITAKGIEWQLGKLRAEGRIRRVGPARGGHWEIQEGRDE